MKQNSKRRVARFLGIMALAACAGGVVGFFGALHADSFSGVLAAVGTALGYAAPALAALAICICCPLAFRAYRKALRLSCSGQDDEALCALETLDVSIIALETQAMVCLCALPFTVALAPHAPAVPLAGAALTLASLLISVFAQRRVIGLVKRLCPEKRGDTIDKNFTREWYASCDEAERARIGFAAYKSFLATQHGFVAAIVVLIIISVATPVGWPAFAAVGALWFVQKFTYFYYGRQRSEK